MDDGQQLPIDLWIAAIPGEGTDHIEPEILRRDGERLLDVGASAGPGRARGGGQPDHLMAPGDQRREIGRHDERLILTLERLDLAVHIDQGPDQVLSGCSPACRHRRELCHTCGMTTATTTSRYKGHRFPHEIVCPQMTKTYMLTRSSRGDHVPDLYVVVRYHHTVDQEFNQLTLLLERCSV